MIINIISILTLLQVMIGYIIERIRICRKISSNDYYIIKYDVDKKNINTNLAQQFFDLVSDNERSKSNLMLVHAYTMYRKMKLIQAEKWFLIKDFGRSGKVYLWKLLRNF